MFFILNAEIDLKVQYVRVGHLSNWYSKTNRGQNATRVTANCLVTWWKLMPSAFWSLNNHSVCDQRPPETGPDLNLKCFNSLRCICFIPADQQEISGCSKRRARNVWMYTSSNCLHALCCVHTFEVVMTTVYMAISVPSGSAQFIIWTDRKNPSPSQSSLDSFLHPSLFSLWKIEGLRLVIDPLTSYYCGQFICAPSAQPLISSFSAGVQV